MQSFAWQFYTQFPFVCKPIHFPFPCNGGSVLRGHAGTATFSAAQAGLLHIKYKGAQEQKQLLTVTLTVWE